MWYVSHLPARIHLTVCFLLRQQTLLQNQKLDKIDSSMSKTTEKQTVVNARQRYLLK